MEFGQITYYKGIKSQCLATTLLIYAGSKLGKFLAKFPLMYASGGMCILLIINGGDILDLLFKTICENEATCHVKPLSSTEWFLVFTCMAILIAQRPKLNSMASGNSRNFSQGIP